MKVALLGLLESGKSTLFSALSAKSITPQGSTHIEEGMVAVPDDRLDWLCEHYNKKKKIYATIDCLDLPGFNFTDEHGRAAAKRFFNSLRTVDLIVFVIRAFNEPSVPAYKNRINPAADIEELKTELLLSDFELVATRIERLEKEAKKPSKTQPHDKTELELQKKLQEAIEAEKPISSAVQNEEELEIIKSLGFLTLKPFVVAVNVDEQKLGEKYDFSGHIENDVPVINISSKLSYELSQLDEQSKKEFMSDLGIKESAAVKFVHSCFSALNLISFLTIGPDEVRAWPVKEKTTALEAAGKIHSDIQRGFIRAETMKFDDLYTLGDEKAVKAAGKVRLEGKDYIVQDGDVIHFRFNV